MLGNLCVGTLSWKCVCACCCCYTPCYREEPLHPDKVYLCNLWERRFLYLRSHKLHTFYLIFLNIFLFIFFCLLLCAVVSVDLTGDAHGNNQTRCSFKLFYTQTFGCLIRQNTHKKNPNICLYNLRFLFFCVIFIFIFWFTAFLLTTKHSSAPKTGTRLIVPSLHCAQIPSLVWLAWSVAEGCGSARTWPQR